MADGLCTEDTVGSILIEKTLVKDYQSLVTSVQTDHSVNDDISTCTNVNSYYLDSDSGYEKYSTSDDSSSKGSDAKQHEGFFAMSSATSDDDCRKKRCSDRYDSSESSDSGVAVLSCTDCSTYSGGSTASSDITDPGSPFSTESSQSEDSSSNQPARMPPNLSAHHPPWPWSSGAESPPLKRATTTAIAANDKTATCPKRLKTEHSTTPNSTNTKDNINKTTLPIKDSNSNHVEAANNKRKKVDSPNVQQGKITEYFKSQMKSNSIKNIIQAGLKTDVINMQKYFTLIDGPKVILTGKKFPDFRKIDLRTVAVPVKKVVLDAKLKKISQLIAVPRKILPAPAPKPKIQSPTVKLTTLRYQNLTYISKKPPDMFKGATGSNNIKSTQPVTKRLTTVPILNLKVSSTVVPIVKLSNMPSKLIGSNLNNNNNSLSVETAVPTVPTFKPKTPTLLEKSTKNELTKKFTSLDSNSNSNCSSSYSSGNVISTNSENSKSSSSLDSDSGVSVRDLLSVSVFSTPTSVDSQKSPILSQPKTIRFPAKQSESRKNQRRSDPADSGLCRWSECQAQFDTSGALLEHLQIKHVISQATQEHYVCLWVGCKVHGRTSCSRSWLERHVLSHAGNKPFRCIVDGCGCRFSSQQTLERHVNSHFNGSENGSTNAKKSLESGQAKLFKRNGKKLRYRRQPWSARMFDFFDAGIMEGLQHRLVTMTEKRTLGEVTKSPGDSVTLQSRILARRTETDGSKKVLLRWYPPDVIPDEWTLESDSQTTRTVSIPTLQPSALDALQDTLFPPKTTTPLDQVQQQQQMATPHRPNRRKRIVVKSS